MIIVAALSLLLLAFGLGFYSYPLVASLDLGTPESEAADRGLNMDAINSGVSGAEGAPLDDGVLSQTASSNLADAANAADDAALLGVQPLEPQAASNQLAEPPSTQALIDLSGVDPTDLEVFLDAWRALDRDFFGDKPEGRQQVYGAIRGLLQSYDDPYTFFIEPETNEVEQGNLRGSFGGIGAHVQPTELGFVLDPIRDNPAQAAGVKAGDYLVQIDDTEITRETPVDDVIALIRGPLNTEVSLGLLRPDDQENITEASLSDAEAITIVVTRAEIRTPSVDWRIITGDEIPVERLLERFRLDDADEANSEGEEIATISDVNSSDMGQADDESLADNQDVLPAGLTDNDIEAWKDTRIGYIQHRIYSDRSPEEMRRAIDELLNEGADRFIIDLRGNPGGPVTSVVQVTDLWIEESLIMFEEKVDGGTRNFEASEDTLVDDEPIIILVDGGTASASEIFAGALRDHERAQILGEKTFGKGSVQVIHILPDSSSMHITNARWFTPDGHKIDGTGLFPDIEVEPGTDSLQEAVIQILDVEFQ